MSQNNDYFPTPDALREENATLYHGLRTFMQSLPDGPWSYKIGYDNSGDGSRYDILLVDGVRRKTELGITAVKQGDHFSFMIVSKSN